MQTKFKIAILLFFYIILSSSCFYGFTNIETNNPTEYTDAVEHLAFNTLMAFPDKALNPQNHLHAVFDETHITPHEFTKILEELYSNNYILIDINSIYKLEDNCIKKQKIFLPKNKKPIILSFNNVSYKSNYQNLGFIDKIIIDRNNQLASYTTKKSIQDRVQYNNEFIMILENFIFSHPDFSHNNARGIIFLTGENGILGYNTSSNNASSRYEKKRAFEVVQKLKSLGWQFGSNGYSYQEQGALSDLRLAKDLSLWKKEVQPLIDATTLFAYPFGTDNISPTQKQMLIDKNFRVFFTINNTNPQLIFDNQTLTMSRREVNGKTLREDTKSFEHLFDCQKVYDHINRTSTYTHIPQ